MFKHIIVPLDGSPSAQHALGLAFELAKAESATLEICSVVDPIEILGRTPPDPLEEAHVLAVKAQAELVVDEAVGRAIGDGICAHGEVLIGEPALEIVAQAKASKADAIVMGTHGRSGFKRLFMGSVAEAVLRSAPCPVIIAREKAAMEAEHRSIPAIDVNAPVYVMRLVQVSPDDFERLYGEIASFMQGPAAELPGCVETEIFGSEDATRIAIVAEFRSHSDWIRAQWDGRLGELLEEIVGTAQTLDFNLYRGDRFPCKRTATP